MSEDKHPTIEFRRVTPDDVAMIAMFDQWAKEAAGDPDLRGAAQCQGLADHVKTRNRPDYEVNYGIVIDGHLVGGILTSGEHFNVIWIHWAATRSRIGPRVTRDMLLIQLEKYGRAFVNQPNAKMCKALRRILASERAAQLQTDMTIRIDPGDLLLEPVLG